MKLFLEVNGVGVPLISCASFGLLERRDRYLT